MRTKGSQEAYVEKWRKKEENSLLVSDWEWLLKAGWHLNAGCSFGILLFLQFFYILNASDRCKHFWKNILRKFNLLK